MQFTTLALSALSAATGVFGAPTTQEAGTTNSDQVIFGVMSIRSASPVHLTAWGAEHKGIFTNLSKQDADCYNSPAQNSATFVLNKADGTLSLYTEGKPWQQLFVDRSGMGQGMMQYTTGAEPAPRNAERGGWAIDEASQHLTFAGSDAFLACPSGAADSSYRILPYVGIENPADYTDCLSIAARVVVAENPVKCLYSQA
ncbi:hypothetical protein QR685DRAFT_164864 [Neurospora intermedia]|uniref:Cell wall protein PhiA n=1 Tax=Neurospora intermedia TaxID=5142 RepID=A0ABR3DKE6_NEUIN